MLLMRKVIPSVRHSISRVTALVVLTALASITLGSLAPSTAHAEDSQSFSGAPAYQDHADSNRTQYNFGGNPGQSFNDSFYIENTGTLPQDVNVYATDAYNADDGMFSLLTSNVAPTGAGTWVSIDGAPMQTITLAPQSSKVLPITVSIPANARPGDHVGGVIASVISPEGQVKLERRVATRMYIRVAGELQPALTVSGLSASYQPDINPFNGNVGLTYVVKNTGNVVLGANVVSAVKGIFGMPLSGLVTSTMPELLPDQSHTMTVKVPGVWQWIWMNASISLAGTVDQNAQSPGALPVADRETAMWAVPWALLILLMAAGFVVLYVRFSRQNNERRSQQWIEYTEAEARLRAREESPES
jgi:hypothetical protein